LNAQRRKLIVWAETSNYIAVFTGVCWWGL